MSIKYNMDEVLQMAERIEGNAAEFYTKAADLHSSAPDIDFLRSMARMENEHRDIFSALRKRLPAAMRQTPDDYPYLKATLYLNEMADVLGGEGTLSQSDPLTASDSLADLLRRGIGFERQAILFYIGIRELVPENRGKKEVDTIVEMEKQHMVELVQHLERVTQARRKKK